MGMRAITVQDAAIRTATVEVRSLVISGRQLTLSVFRQLPERDLIASVDERPALTGQPWGLVNYFWGDQDRTDLHVVWQDGDRLYRDLIPRDAQRHRLYREWRMEIGDDIGNWFIASVAEGAISPYDAERAMRKDMNGIQRLRGVYFDMEWKDIWLAPASELNGYESRVQECAANMRARYASNGRPIAGQEAAIVTDIATLRAWAVEYERLVITLAALDQLFIAV